MRALFVGVFVRVYVCYIYIYIYICVCVCVCLCVCVCVCLCGVCVCMCIRVCMKGSRSSIFRLNISRTVTDLVNIANANTLKVEFSFAYLYLIFTHYKGQSQGQGQGHAHFHCEFIANGYRLGTQLPTNRKSYVGFRSADLNLTLAYSKGQVLYGYVLRTNCWT